MTLQRKLARHVAVFEGEQWQTQAVLPREEHALAALPPPPPEEVGLPLTPLPAPEPTPWEELAQVSALAYPQVTATAPRVADPLPTPAATFFQRAKPQAMENEE